MSSAYPAKEGCQPLAVCTPSYIHVTSQHVSEDGVGTPGLPFTTVLIPLCACVCVCNLHGTLTVFTNNATPFCFTLLSFSPFCLLIPLHSSIKINPSTNAQLRPKGRLVIFTSYAALLRCVKPALRQPSLENPEYVFSTLTPVQRLLCCF